MSAAQSKVDGLDIRRQHSFAAKGDVGSIGPHGESTVGLGPLGSWGLCLLQGLRHALQAQAAETVPGGPFPELLQASGNLFSQEDGV